MAETLQTLRALEARVDALERYVALAGLSVEGALRRRGWQPGARSTLDHVLLPRPPEFGRVNRFYQDLRHYHFRRLLQEVAEHGTLPSATVRQLERRWGPRAVGQTFARLTEYGLLDRRRGVFCLTEPAIHTFGETLEWFVAQVFMREFLAPAAWGVHIREIRYGGDFDVLVVLDGRLGYIECKGSPPYNVPASVLAQFLQRTRQLGPDFTVFLIDTTLRIERNIIANLASLLKSPRGTARGIARLSDGIYEAGGSPALFIVTSRRSLVANLSRCLRRLHTGSALGNQAGAGGD